MYIVIGIMNDLYRDKIFWSYRTALRSRTVWLRRGGHCNPKNHLF